MDKILPPKPKFFIIDQTKATTHGRPPSTEAHLLVIKQGVALKVVHDGFIEKEFKNLTSNGKEGYWPKIIYLPFVP